MFSIVIPTWNNLAYLQCCIASIKKNSHFVHQIIVHVNDGSDGTAQWCIDNNIIFSHTMQNEGVCVGVNMAACLATQKWIVYMNDDMYCCPSWDLSLQYELEKLDAPNYMLSATMIEPRSTGNPCVVVQDYGDGLENFCEADLLATFAKYYQQNWSGAFWPPTLVPLSLWQKVGGFSESFSPGMSSDDDFAMKCWQAGCRVYLGVGNSLVYHFQTKSTGRIVKNNGKFQFLQKWNLRASDFRTYYLRLGKPYNGAQRNPSFFAKTKMKIIASIKLLGSKNI